MRMQHYALFLQGFNYTIKYRNTKAHANTDCLSRLPQKQTRESEFDVVDVFELQTIEMLPVTLAEIQSESLKDKQLTKIVLAL